MLQVCRAELATVEEHKRELEKARQPEPVETWCESDEESAWIFMSEMDQKKRSDGAE